MTQQRSDGARMRGRGTREGSRKGRWVLVATSTRGGAPERVAGKRPGVVPSVGPAHTGVAALGTGKVVTPILSVTVMSRRLQCPHAWGLMSLQGGRDGWDSGMDRGVTCRLVVVAILGDAEWEVQVAALWDVRVGGMGRGWGRGGTLRRRGRRSKRLPWDRHVG